MHNDATPGEKITPDTINGTISATGASPPEKPHPEVELISAAACGHRSGSSFSGNPKSAWMRSSTMSASSGHLLCVKWGMFAVPWCSHFSICGATLGLRPSASPFTLDSPSFEGHDHVSLPGKSLSAASDALRGISADLSPQALMWVSGVA